MRIKKNRFIVNGNIWEHYTYYVDKSWKMIANEKNTKRNILTDGNHEIELRDTDIVEWEL